MYISGICFVEKILQCGMLKRGDFMESFFVALNAVLPMFIMLFIGFLVRKLKILQDSFLPQLNKIVFNVFFRFLCSITSTAQIFKRFQPEAACLCGYWRVHNLLFVNRVYTPC